MDLKQHIGLLQQLGHKQVYPAILINIKQHLGLLQQLGHKHLSLPCNFFKS